MSAWRRSASAAATSVLPSAVAPNRATTGVATARRVLAAPGTSGRPRGLTVDLVVARRLAFLVTGHGEPLDAERLAGADARLLQGDVDLLLHGVDALQVGQQDAPAKPGEDDHAVDRGVEAGLRARRARAEHVHRTRERRELVRPHAVEARIVEGRRARVTGDLGAEVRFRRLQGADAATQLAAILERDEAGGVAREERVCRRPLQWATQDAALHAGAGVVGGT